MFRGARERGTRGRSLLNLAVVTPGPTATSVTEAVTLRCVPMRPEYRRSSPLLTARQRMAQVTRLGHQLAPIDIDVVPGAPVDAGRLELCGRQGRAEVLGADPGEPGPGAADPFQDVGVRGA